MTENNEILDWAPLEQTIFELAKKEWPPETDLQIHSYVKLRSIALLRIEELEEFI